MKQVVKSVFHLIGEAIEEMIKLKESELRSRGIIK